MLCTREFELLNHFHDNFISLLKIEEILWLFFFPLSLLYPFVSDSFPMRSEMYQVHLWAVYVMIWGKL